MLFPICVRVYRGPVPQATTPHGPFNLQSVNSELLSLSEDVFFSRTCSVAYFFGGWMRGAAGPVWGDGVWVGGGGVGGFGGLEGFLQIPVQKQHSYVRSPKP